jgi:tetratricopeptide (TPR) repeat protein
LAQPPPVDDGIFSSIHRVRQSMGDSADRVLLLLYLLKGDEVVGDSLLNTVIANAQTSASNDEKRYGIAAINALNNFDIKKRDYKSIVDRCKIGTQINPQSAIVWLYLGIGYQGLKDLDNAKVAYQAVLKIDPNNQMAKKNLQSLGR